MLAQGHVLMGLVTGNQRNRRGKERNGCTHQEISTLATTLEVEKEMQAPKSKTEKSAGEQPREISLGTQESQERGRQLT